MIIAPGISEQDNFHRSEIPLEKTWEIDNEARISKIAIKEKKIQQKSEAHNSVIHPAKLSNIIASSYHFTWLVGKHNEHVCLLVVSRLLLLVTKYAICRD